MPLHTQKKRKRLRKTVRKLFRRTRKILKAGNTLGTNIGDNLIFYARENMKLETARPRV